MDKYHLIIGSHVSLSKPDFLLGAVNEAISYEANTYMFYTGAPQNTVRQDIQLFKKEDAYNLMYKNAIDPKNVIVHAPYIINLCSNKIETRNLAKSFLIKELERVAELGFKYLVLHPGSRIDQQYEIAIKQIIDGINYAHTNAKNEVMILLETMAGKGSEVGNSIDDIAKIIKGIKQQDRIGVCIDTCHISDAGYNLANFDDYLKSFEAEIGLEYIKCLHINDSMNRCGARKDRHQNIGYGYIGFENLLHVIYHPKLNSIPKILETPYAKVDNKFFPPYKEEIAMIRNMKFNHWLKK